MLSPESQFLKISSGLVEEITTLQQLNYEFSELLELKTDKERQSFLSDKSYYHLSPKEEHQQSTVNYNRFLERVFYKEAKVVKGYAIPKWLVEPLSQEEQTYLADFYVKSIRSQRDKLLAESDWTQLEDVPEDIKLKWKEYRQALRELPNVFLETKECVWPIQPN